jgi:undecaprenyl pyrophosphate phosphatase UppP
MAPGAAAVGISMAFVAGYAALAGLVSALASQKLRYFTGYLVTLGLLVLLFS